MKFIIVGEYPEGIEVDRDDVKVLEIGIETEQEAKRIKKELEEEGYSDIQITEVREDRETDFNHRYDLEIRKFFEGQDICLRDFSNDFLGKGKGHVWICSHGLFDTLTVEPPEGGQYEIAIRIRVQKDNNGPVHGVIGCQEEKWAGYKITGDGWLVGYNTDGH